ncbi:MAG: ribbon-helix-helix domain-containing protein [Candidatus Thorarchaeota archaeon]|nr:MAG: transcriptional regulator [Candidatus Thorarchaeota archaeon]RLI55483.1 MAG: transcriptional regulator [Candidatus Thorarchaeota archaeon]
MRVVTICVPDEYLKGVKELIEQNRYPNRSEVIRIAIRDLLVDELWGERRVGDGTPLVAQLQKLNALESPASLQTPPP